MHETLHQYDVDHEVHHRIVDLHSTASELRTARVDGDGASSSTHAGLVARTRSAVGRQLVALGQSVAGQQHAA